MVVNWLGQTAIMSGRHPPGENGLAIFSTCVVYSYGRLYTVHVQCP